MNDLIARRIGRYQIQSEVGTGGMATVFKALHLDRHEIVALKILAPQLALSEKFKARFAREAKVLSELDHPNIVPLLDYGEQGGMAHIVMPFMEVGTLSDRLELGSLTPKEAARIFTQVAQALQHAHDHGVIHRDVKPSNVLIDDDGNVSLSDFGFAQVTDASINLTGSALVGTPAYMSPEQIHGGEVTPKTDQYALGVILYQLTTGQLPFEAETPMALAVKHATEPLPRPRKINPNLPDAVEAVLMKALSKNPEDRYDTVADLDEAFQGALKDSIDPITGHLKPGAVGLKLRDLPVETTEAIQEEAPAEEEARSFKRSALIGVLLALLACPLTVWGISTLASGGNPTPTQLGFIAQVTEVDLMSTVAALATENAPGPGTLIAPGQIETAVAATLTAMPDGSGTEHPAEIPEIGEGTTTITPTVLLGTDAPSSTPTLVRSSTRTATNTRTSVPGAPSQTPSMVPGTTTTPTPILAPSQTATFTQTVPPIVTTVIPLPSSTEDVCQAISLTSFGVGGKFVGWTLTNGSGQLVTVVEIYLYWPSENEELKKVKLSTDTIWDKDDENPPTTITSGWNGGVDKRMIASGASKWLSFEFDEDALSSGYSVGVGFGAGCSVGSSG